MSTKSRTQGRIVLAIAMGIASLAMGAAHANGKGEAPGISGKNQGLTLYMADPELGVAGSYVLNGNKIYFEARRGASEENAERGELSIRLVDADARTLAMSGNPLEDHWSSTADSLSASDARTMPAVLAGLAKELAQTQLHVSVGEEQLALASFANQAARSPAHLFPMMVEGSVDQGRAVDETLVADFHDLTAAQASLQRSAEGALSARFGNGLSYDSIQSFRIDEEDEQGRPGRVDVYSRVLDAQGNALSAEFGGDHIPLEWDASLETENAAERSHDELAKDLGAAATALNALSHKTPSVGGAAFSSKMEAESMQRLARGLSEMLLPRRASASDISDQGGMLMATGRYQTRLVLHKKPFVVIAQHSATRVYKRLYASTSSSSYSTTATLNYCNHGTCVGGDKMSSKCSYTSPRMGSYRAPARRSDAGGHTCSTGYFATATVPLRHNCHDDSSVQVRAVRGLSYSHDGGRCKDWTYWAWAPSCD